MGYRRFCLIRAMFVAARDCCYSFRGGSSDKMIVGPVMEHHNVRTASAGPAEGHHSAIPDAQRVMRMHVPVIVKLAGKKMTVEVVTAITTGTIIEFDKRADDELELKIRNKTIGFGQAVKVGEKFGLRIASICDIRDTIRTLGE